MPKELHGKTPHLRRKPVMDGEEYLAKLAEKNLTPDGGALVPDPTPIAPPVGYVKQPTITERIRDMVRSERLRAEAEAAGAETFEEAEDFDVGDDYDPTSPYEEIFDPPIPVIDRGSPPLGEGEGARGSKSPSGGQGQASRTDGPATEPPAASAAGDASTGPRSTST